jgi:hypothetical protein
MDEIKQPKKKPTVADLQRRLNIIKKKHRLMTETLKSLVETKGKSKSPAQKKNKSTPKAQEKNDEIEPAKAKTTKKKKKV